MPKINMIHKVFLNGDEYQIAVIFTNNKNAYLERKNETIILKTPVHLFKTPLLENFILKSLPSLLKKQDRPSYEIDLENRSFNFFGELCHFEYDGKQIIFNHQNFEIKLKCSNTDLIESTLWKYLSKRLYSVLVDLCTWFKFKGIVEKFSPLKIQIRQKKSAWATNYVEKKLIIFSKYLVCFSIEIISYVLAHELSHFFEANHSKKFWNIVRSLDPDYKKKKQQLNDHIFKFKE
ncbi:Protein of uncharacterised function DUF45 [Metamycoplasma arthritidis]|nr:YgjP-like metallopeptidase domain-containing protein [Metamycoplasma arthritidis]VEU78624.1 Protein of uncharacterised function DUF45 [Metamycoplasma arthritidis]